MLKGKQDKLRQFGGKLYLMRKARGMTQRQLADAMDIDYRQVSRYETGSAEMGAMLYDQMLDVLGMRSNDCQTQEAIRQFSTLSPANKEKAIEYMLGLNILQR